ncbi:MAG: SagB/ThcOx family dehydrogenase [Betaproteobacteria bacterium]|nr:SagB/ThcOx family dehydrogenase [Betaproteobacteria bacterium]
MRPYRLSDYHERSKHRLNRYAPGPGWLDWANQPEAFRSFEGAARIELPLGADLLAARYNDLRRGTLQPPQPIGLDSIAILLELSLGVSAWKSYGGASWALRCNPSSGNLHPTEGYLVAGQMPGIDAGIYHYHSRDHALERRGAWLASASRSGLDRGFLVGLTSIHWREAWKYGMRAFRYCQHDCGHAIAAVAYAAAALGWRARVLVWPADAEIAALLGLNRDEDFAGAEREAPECLIWIGSPGAEPAIPAPPEHWSGAANRLSSKHVGWEDIERVAQCTEKPGTEAIAARSIAPPASEQLVAGPRLDLSAARVIRQRRSAQAFDGETSIGDEAFYAMLEATLVRDGTPPWCAWPYAIEAHPMLFVHRVEGLEPGLYAFVRDPQALEPLRAALRSDWLWQRVGPDGLPLYLLLAYDLRDAARAICCHQDIAADSCFALGMLARFERARAEPWRYRALHWECGILGQVLYLEAEAAGIRGTGIGCFFDDEMHALLGLQGNAWQSLYHFTAGNALEDVRLTSLPAYAFERPRSPARNIR